MTRYVDDLEMDTFQSQIDDGDTLSLDECRHLLAEVRRLAALLDRGNLLVPLTEWEHSPHDHSLRVLIALPYEEVRRLDRARVEGYLDGVLGQIKATYLRCWEKMNNA